MDADNSSGLIDIETTYDFGFLFSGGGGYAWRNGFRADAEMLYATYDLDQVSVTRATGLGVATGSRDAEGDLSILALMANGAYDFDLGFSWRPYLLAGAGVAQVSLNDVTAGGAIVDDEAFVVAFQAGLGVNYALTDNWSLKAGLQVLHDPRARARRCGGKPLRFPGCDPQPAVRHALPILIPDRRAPIFPRMNCLDIDKAPSATRVVVAMSGGVDSSTVAAMLVEDGFDVVGVTLQLYDHGRARGRPGSCCAGEDIHDARRVADRLGIPHYVLGYEQRFRSQVIDAFAGSYAAGETPVPCILCNQTVKFTDLLGTARDLGADALVTGHYVRRRQGPDGPELHRAADGTRDQSYFLFATTSEQLGYLRFPLGERTKSDTRGIADRFGLAVAEKPDSQDICFVPDGRYARVVEALRPEAFEPGDIVDDSGAVLGRHGGIARFTIGQRRGLGIAGDQPLYVNRIEPETRRVVVGPRESLLQPNLRVGDVNWLGDGDGPGAGRRVQARVRSTRPPAAATLQARDDGTINVVFDRPEAGIAPGQACVFYDGDRVLGGGWILREDPLAA